MIMCTYSRVLDALSLIEDGDFGLRKKRLPLSYTDIKNRVYNNSLNLIDFNL